MTILTTLQAAARLGVADTHVRWLIANGRLRATKHGRAWLIEERDCDRVKLRPAGRQKADPKGHKR